MKPENENSKIFSKEEAKRLFRPLLLLFLINFLIINWNDIYWVFNYRVISGIVSSFFEKISNKRNSISQLEKIDYFNKEDGLEIPKIGVLAPLIIVEDSNEKDFDEELDRGVVHFPDSVLPGEIGQTIILGHSAPPNWPKIKYDWVFSRINELEKGDEILIYFNNQRYSYSVTKKTFLEKEEKISENNLTDFQNMLVLISCWPPGKDIRRIAVAAIINSSTNLP